MICDHCDARYNDDDWSYCPDCGELPFESYELPNDVVEDMIDEDSEAEDEEDLQGEVW